MKRNLLLVMIILFLCVSSCKKNDDINPDIPDNPDPEVTVVSVTVEDNALVTLYSDEHKEVSEKISLSNYQHSYIHAPPYL